MNGESSSTGPPGELSFLTGFWRWLRPHILTDDSRWEGMDTGAQFDIGVFPLSETSDEMLIHAMVDRQISHSLISSSKAAETGHQANSCDVVSVKDCAGQEYKAWSYVTLRWRRKGAGRTQGEDFYIVDKVTPDVIFAKSAVRDRPQTNTHILEHQPQTSDQIEAQKLANSLRKDQREAQKTAVKVAEAAQREKLRKGQK